MFKDDWLDTIMKFSLAAMMLTAAGVFVLLLVGSLIMFTFGGTPS